jgi:hypothetical protein
VALAVAVLLFAQTGICAGDAARYALVAEERAQRFDLTAAADAWTIAAGKGCQEGDTAAHFLKGLLAAREAYTSGGSAESLRPVNDAIAALEARGAKTPGIPEIARFVLMAASAAAQSERDSLMLLIDHAIRLEAIQLEAGQGGTPGVTAHEAAGDLFLQVHRYEDARMYYRRAAERFGLTPRIRVGLARSALRLGDRAVACEEYRGLLAWWGERADPPAEVREAFDVTANGCPDPRR